MLAISLDVRLAMPSQLNAQLGGKGDRRALEESLAWSDCAVLGGNTLRVHRTTCLIRSSDLINKRVDLLVEEDEINQRIKNNKFKYPPNQTPWQEIAREYVGQLGEGACLDLKEKYLDIAREKGIPRDNH